MPSRPAFLVHYLDFEAEPASVKCVPYIGDTPATDRLADLMPDLDGQLADQRVAPIVISQLKFLLFSHRTVRIVQDAQPGTVR